MTQQEYISRIEDGTYLEKGTEMTACMRQFAREAQRITAEINGRYHTAEELNALVSELIGKPVDESFALFPPIYTDFGRNITFGKNVFVNSGCCFQDQGGSDDRRRHSHRASGGVCHAQPYARSRRPFQHDGKTHNDREERVDRIARDRFGGCEGGRQQRRCGGRRGHQVRPAQCRRCGRAGEDSPRDKVPAGLSRFCLCAKGFSGNVTEQDNIHKIV